MKPKYKIGDKVRCKEHGTEFIIKNIFINYINEILYYGSKKKSNVCQELNHCGIKMQDECYFGVPEHLIEKIEDNQHKFKVGDRVKLVKVKDLWLTGDFNPIFKDTYICGEIYTLEYGINYNIGVRWDNGNTNGYSEEHLEKVNTYYDKNIDHEYKEGDEVEVLESIFDQWKKRRIVNIYNNILELNAKFHKKCHNCITFSKLIFFHDGETRLIRPIKEHNKELEKEKQIIGFYFDDIDGSWKDCWGYERIVHNKNYVKPKIGEKIICKGTSGCYTLGKIMGFIYNFSDYKFRTYGNYCVLNKDLFFEHGIGNIVKSEHGIPLGLEGENKQRHMTKEERAIFKKSIDKIYKPIIKTDREIEYEKILKDIDNDITNVFLCQSLWETQLTDREIKSGHLTFFDLERAIKQLKEEKTMNFSICEHVEKIAMMKYPKASDVNKRNKLIAKLRNNQGIINEMLTEKWIEDNVDNILSMLEQIEKEDK